MELRPQTDTLPIRASLIGRLRAIEGTNSRRDLLEYQQRIARVVRNQNLIACAVGRTAWEVFKCVARAIPKYQISRHPGSYRRWLANFTRCRATDLWRERACFLPNQNRALRIENREEISPMWIPCE
jgi:hypothetical protein